MNRKPKENDDSTQINPITDDMYNISESQLLQIDELQLFELVWVQIEIMRGKQKPAFELQSILKMDERTVRLIHQGRSHLSMTHWLVLSKRFRIVQRWLDAKLLRKEIQ